MTELTEVNNQMTMSSTDLVAYENSFREELARKAGVEFPSKGYAKLEHSDFLKKVPEVLGERAGNFSGTFDVPGPNKAVRKSPCYYFPKREACLMAMSYSYELQARVFDRMMELEQEVQRLTLEAAKEKLRLEVEADYRENLKHCDEHEVGSALISAVKCVDEDGEGILHGAIQGIDFEQAAKVQGVSVEHIKARTLAHIAATNFVGQLQRGEHQHKDRVMGVIQWARSVVSARKAKAEILEHQKREALRHQTLAQIDAYDMIHKHDNPYLPVGPAPRKRALRKQPVRKAK